jgi:hypothetical protein
MAASTRCASLYLTLCPFLTGGLTARGAQARAGVDLWALRTHAAAYEADLARRGADAALVPRVLSLHDAHRRATEAVNVARAARNSAATLNAAIPLDAVCVPGPNPRVVPDTDPMCMGGACL